MNNYDPDWQYFGFFPLKFPSKKGLKLASSRHPPPLSGLPGTRELGAGLVIPPKMVESNIGYYSNIINSDRIRR